MTAALLRVFFALVVLVGLNTSHFGMASAAQNMPMAHMTNAASAMDHGSESHQKTNGSLCATICAGTNPSEAIAFQARHVGFATVRWLVAAKLVWVSPTPDPALRPPDALHNA